MGGDTQPQILLQLLTRFLRHSETPGRAVAAGRWALHNPRGTAFDTWADPDALTVIVEGHTPPAWAAGLRDRGHAVNVVPSGHGFGHAQLIEVGTDGIRRGAADPRAEVGAAVGC
jgi:gamma-glutamyltranspeptidase/glutathione hydrolase